jgi:hypothetical protein
MPPGQGKAQVGCPSRAASTAVPMWPPRRAPPALRNVGQGATLEAAPPPAPSASPSIRPRAAAGARSVAVKKLGRITVGTLFPAPARKLARPILNTPGVRQERHGFF